MLVRLRSGMPSPRCRRTVPRRSPAGPISSRRCVRGAGRSPRVVDLKKIPELTSISVCADGSLVLGAAASAAHVARHAVVASTYPAVAQSARLIGSLQVQNRASLGGNICNAAPSADAVPAPDLLPGQGAHCRPARPTRGGAGRASPLPPARPAWRPASCLRLSLFRPSHQRSAATYLRFTPRREMDIAIAGSAAWVCLDAAGKNHRGAFRAGVGRADAGAGDFRRTAAHRRDAPRAPCSRQPGDSRRPTHVQSRTHVPPPTTAARWSQVLTARALSDCCSALSGEEVQRDEDVHHLHRQRRAADGSRRHARHAARPAARAHRAHRNQGRLWQRQLRHVHGAGRRCRR